jgi:hypothetical protein
MISNQRTGMRYVMAAALLAVSSCSRNRADGQHSHGAVANSLRETPLLDATPATEADIAWLTAKAVSSLEKTFRAAGLEATEQGQTVAVAGKRIGVSARINDRVERNGRSIIAVDFDVLVNGARVPAFAAGAVGVDDTAEHARETAVAEWAAEYGAPIGFALAARFGGNERPSPSDRIAPFSAKLELDGQTLFHGPPGLRGEAKIAQAVSSDDFVRQVAMSVVPSFRGAPRLADYRSATIQVVVQGTAISGGECRVDGLVSPGLLQALSKLRWPEGSPSYMFKLFFVGPAANN